MTNNFKQTSSNNFGGEIYESDFNTSYNVCKNITQRIEAARKFDEMCKYQAKNTQMFKEKNKKRE